MNREKRHFIHEYCEHFGCQSEAYDEEPNKNVVATAQRGMVSISSFICLELKKDMYLTHKSSTRYIQVHEIGGYCLSVMYKHVQIYQDSFLPYEHRSSHPPTMVHSLLLSPSFTSESQWHAGVTALYVPL